MSYRTTLSLVLLTTLVLLTGCPPERPRSHWVQLRLKGLMGQDVENQVVAELGRAGQDDEAVAYQIETLAMVGGERSRMVLELVAEEPGPIGVRAAAALKARDRDEPLAARRERYLERRASDALDPELSEDERLLALEELVFAQSPQLETVCSALFGPRAEFDLWDRAVRTLIGVEEPFLLPALLYAAERRDAFYRLSPGLLQALRQVPEYSSEEGLVEATASYLHSSDPRQRIGAMMLLAQVPADEALPPLATILGQDRPILPRTMVLEMLSNYSSQQLLGSDRTLLALRALTLDQQGGEESRGRALAILNRVPGEQMTLGFRALLRREGDDGAIERLLLALAEDPRPGLTADLARLALDPGRPDELRIAAIRAHLQAPRSDWKQLLELFGEPNDRIRQVAYLEAGEELGFMEVEILNRGLDDPVDSIRAHSVRRSAELMPLVGSELPKRLSELASEASYDYVDELGLFSEETWRAVATGLADHGTIEHLPLVVREVGRRGAPEGEAYPEALEAMIDRLRAPALEALGRLSMSAAEEDRTRLAAARRLLEEERGVEARTTRLLAWVEDEAPVIQAWALTQLATMERTAELPKGPGLKALESDEEAVRLAGIRYLQRAIPKDADDPTTRALAARFVDDDEAHSIRQLAAMLLGKIGTEAAVLPLGQAEDEVSSRRADDLIGRALASWEMLVVRFALGSDEGRERFRAELLLLVEVADDAGQELALRTLLEEFPAPEGELIYREEALDGDTPAIRRLATRLLHQVVGESAVPVLLEIAREDDERAVREEALDGLVALGGSEILNALAALEQGLRREAAGTRSQTGSYRLTQRANRVGEAHARLVARLAADKSAEEQLALYRDLLAGATTEDARVMALEQLMAVKTLKRFAVLVEIFPEAAVQEQILMLRRLPPRTVSDDARKLLALGLETEDQEVQLEALQAWIKVQWPEVQSAVEALADDPDAEVRRAVLEAAGQLPAATSERLVERGLRDDEWEVRRAAIDMLRQMESPPLGRVRPLLDDDAGEVRLAALRLLLDRGESFQDAEIADLVLRALDDPAAGVRKLAAREAGERKLEAATERLVELAENDESFAVRTAAEQALEAIFSDD